MVEVVDEVDVVVDELEVVVEELEVVVDGGFVVDVVAFVVDVVDTVLDVEVVEVDEVVVDDVLDEVVDVPGFVVVLLFWATMNATAIAASSNTSTTTRAIHIPTRDFVSVPGTTGVVRSVHSRPSQYRRRSGCAASGSGYQLGWGSSPAGRASLVQSSPFQ